MTSHFAEPEPRPERIERVDLGDLVGDDERLRAALPAMEAQVNADAPCTRAKRTLDLLAIVKLPFVKTLSGLKKAVDWVADRLLDREIRRAQARKIEAEAELIHAEAGVEEARAEKVRAQADAIGAQAIKTAAEAVTIERQSKAEYLERLKKLGIDFRAELAEDGTLKVVVTKGPAKKPRGKGKSR